MKKVLFTFGFLGCFFVVQAHRFKPYHSFGLQLNYAYSYVFYEVEPQLKYITYIQADRFSGGLHTIDVYAHYNFGFHKWLGASSGLGFINRGAKNEKSFNNEVEARRDLYYATVPLLLQIKPFRSFWLEGGVELRSLLYYKDEGYENNGSFTNENPDGTLYYGPFNTENLERFTLSWQAGFRAQMYHGLSFTMYWQSFLSPIAEQPERYEPEHKSVFYNYSLNMGLSYMFNQPRK